MKYNKNIICKLTVILVITVFIIYMFQGEKSTIKADEYKQNSWCYVSISQSSPKGQVPNIILNDDGTYIFNWNTGEKMEILSGNWSYILPDTNLISLDAGVELFETHGIHAVRLWDEGNGIMRIEIASSPPVNDIEEQTLGITKTGDLFVLENA